MADDIVKRLWYTSAYLRTMEEADIREATEDAADEIERLRTAGDALVDALDGSRNQIRAAADGWNEARRG